MRYDLIADMMDSGLLVLYGISKIGQAMANSMSTAYSWPLSNDANITAQRMSSRTILGIIIDGTKWRSIELHIQSKNCQEKP
jgi:hypothetical protein